MVVAPCLTVNVTVPTFTAPAVLVTVAVSGTLWLLVLKLAEALAAVVVVPATLTVSVCVLSVLVAKPPAGVYPAVMVCRADRNGDGRGSERALDPAGTVPEVTAVPMV